MFRPMRRLKRQIPDEAARALLLSCRRAAFSVNGDDGYPYTVPINFWYDKETDSIYFHSAAKGHKIDSIRKDDRVCFTVWNDGELPEDDWAYYVSSCVVFGRAAIVTDEATKMTILRRFALKYYPVEAEADEEIRKDGAAVQMIRIRIEHLSGKRIHEK